MMQKVKCVTAEKHFQAGKTYKLIDIIDTEKSYVVEDEKGEWWLVGRKNFKEEEE